MAHGQGGAEVASDRSPTLTCNHEAPYVAHSLRGEGFDASEDGTGRGTPLVPVGVRDCAPMIGANYGKQPDSSDTSAGPMLIPMAYATKLHNTSSNQAGKFYENYTASLDANSPPPAIVFDTTQITSAANYSNPTPGDPCHPLAAGAHAPAIAIQAGALRTNPASGPDGVGVQSDHAYTLEARSEVQCVQFAQQVRRLTPRECERLQGFPDGHTDVRAGGTPDGPRYKAIGNSMAVPVIEWIGRRIENAVLFGE